MNYKNRYNKIQNKKQLAIASLFFVLIFANIFSLIKINSLNKKNPEEGKYTMIDPMRNSIPQSDFITNIQPLRDVINKKVDEFGRDKVSIYIEYLNTGSSISVNPEKYIWPASLLKLPLAMTVMKKVEDGEWNMNDQLVLMAGDIDKRSGDPNSKIYNSPVGTKFTVEELVKELIINSDNSSYDILVRNTNDQDVRKIIDAIGLEKLANNDGKISAKEYSRLLRSLYTASFLSRENSQKILEWMDQSNFDGYLSSVVPQNVPFPHKYGKNIKGNVYADSGIVYIGKRAYIISVMVQGDKNIPSSIEEEKAKKFMQEISKMSYEYFLNYKN